MIEILFSILLLILAINSIYLLVFSLAAFVKKNSDKPKNNHNHQNSFVILIPGYKEDRVIIESAKAALSQNYPVRLFKCVVIADDFSSDTIKYLFKMGVEVIQLRNDTKRTKAKAIQYYLNKCHIAEEACVLLDADNVIGTDFLEGANRYLNEGYEIVQANRVAKNQNTDMARLDSLSEIANNFIFRKGQRALGLSSSLIGSGIITKMGLFQKVMKGMDVISGFDKEMEIRLLEQGVKIRFAEDLEVKDEKVDSEEVFVGQRRRWNYAQWFFFRKYAGKSVQQLFQKGNFDYFNKVIQFALLPRIVVLGASAIAAVLSPFIGLSFLVCAVLNLILVSFSLILPLHQHISIQNIWPLFSRLPQVFIKTLKSIITARQAAKNFIHTPHNS